MSEVYQKNFRIFRERYPKAAPFIDSLQMQSYNVENEILKIQVTENHTEAVGTPLKDKPVLDFTQQLVDKEQLIVVMGFGLGWLVQELRRQSPRARIMVIEHDARIFKAALASVDLSHLLQDPWIDYFISLKAEIMVTRYSQYFMQPDIESLLPSIQLVTHGHLVKLSQNYYQKASQAIRKAVDYYWDSLVGNDYQDSLRGATNVLVNLKHYKKMMAIEPYRDHFKGCLGVVVSSGPSLQTKLQALKQIQDRAVIICADSSLKLLLQHGIAPFGVACVERDEELIDCFRGIDIPKSTCLFAVPQIREEIIRDYQGPTVLLFRDTFPFGWLPDLVTRRNIGMSCSHLALLMLFLLGCEEVALFGQDLAYARSGDSHAQGIAGGYTEELKQRFGYQNVLDNQGTEIVTNHFWALYRDVFEQIIAQHPQHRVYNVIEKDQGAHIQGAECVPLQFWLDKCQTAPAAVSFDPSEGKSFLQNQEQRFFEQLNAKKEKSIHGLQELSQRLNDFAQLQNSSSYFVKNQELMQSLDKDVKYLYQSMFVSMIKRFEAAARCVWTDGEFVANCRLHIEASQKAIQELITVLLGGQHE